MVERGNLRWCSIELAQVVWFCVCTVDNLLAKTRGLSSCTDEKNIQLVLHSVVIIIYLHILTWYTDIYCSTLETILYSYKTNRCFKC